MPSAITKTDENIKQKNKSEIKNKKIIKKEQIEIKMKRQTTIYIEIINKKRNENEEPKVTKKKITSSAFLTLEDEQKIEIMYLCQTYTPVIRRLLDESRDKIKEIKISLN